MQTLSTYTPVEKLGLIGFIRYRKRIVVKVSANYRTIIFKHDGAVYRYGVWYSAPLMDPRGNVIDRDSTGYIYIQRLGGTDTTVWTFPDAMDAEDRFHWWTQPVGAR